MKKFISEGSINQKAKSKLFLPGGNPEVRTAVQMGAAARGATSKVSVAANYSDLVEVELDNGIVFWTSLKQLQEDTKSLRNHEATDFDLPSHYPSAQPADRGIIGCLIKSLKFLHVDLPKDAALWAAKRIESKLEQGNPGFYRINRNGNLEKDRIISGSKPVLVFIHGTASSTRGAYSGLIETPEMAIAWKSLINHYNGRIFGFEHRTLTESPMTNAIQFLKALPTGNLPPLHLVSHSRGGLVGDLLSFGGLNEAFPEELLDAAGVEKQKSEFMELNGLLASRRPEIQRFVRVACPAGGTTLASGRLDIYLSLMIRILGKTPAIGPFLEGLGELVAAVAKERTDPGVLPGLQAQMPTSPLIRVLNTSKQLDSDLTVIAGDSDGFLKNLANLFYWGANDLVVDTRSMYRGAPRSTRRWYRSEGRDVEHFNYFTRKETVNKLIEGLTRSDYDQDSFSTDQPRSVERSHVPTGDVSDHLDKPTVILIPGIMGSHLRVNYNGGSNRVWLDISDIMKGRFRKLAIGASGMTVEPDKLIKSAYGDFAAYLRKQNQHVIPFDYDWRISIQKAASRLNDLLVERLQKSTEPIRIIAHSMGGLVARYLIANHRDTWDRIVFGGGRLVQLGTPNNGSYLIPYLLLGKEKLLKKLALVDLKNSTEQWVKWISRFPGLLEMAPQSDHHDFFNPDTWADLKVLATPRMEDLQSASQVVEKMASVNLADHPVVYVAGRADKTPTMKPTGNQICFTHRGDGRVTWESGIPKGVDHWFIDTKHGSLADCKSAFPGLLDLVNTGKTDRLASIEPSPRSRPELSKTRFVDEDAEVFPSQETLEAAILGMAESEFEEPAWTVKPQCSVRVMHGNLDYADHPVMVGHYAGDPIISAEKALDKHVDGALSQRHLLDLYPREVGSHEIVLPRRTINGRQTAGAIVVGLGGVGNLSPGGLSRTVEEAVVRYVHLSNKENGGIAQGGWGLATLLIGSGEAGLTLSQVLESILIGVKRANRRLGAESPIKENSLGIAHVDFIEIYQDRAIEALHVLKKLSDFSLEEFHIKPELVRREGGLHRVTHSEASGWWTPLTISGSDKKPGLFKFTVQGKRARVASEPLQIQPQLVNLLLDCPPSSASSSYKKVSQTLFELLLPCRLKGAAVDQNQVLLVLNKSAARFPWEMLLDRKATGDRPLGVEAGLIRKLLVKTPPLVSHPESKLAMVVGDPPSLLQPLQGARKEARQIADLLSHNSWTVSRQIRQDSGSMVSPGKSEIDTQSIMTTLMTEDFRILHLAGHGYYNPDDPSHSGMVLAGDPLSKDSVQLTPIEANQMRLAPELVFINCCHLGRIESTPPHLLAANLATQFIRNGVRAVVAAGWAVDDDAALTFANTFYKSMLAGGTFGDAVLVARRKTYSDHSNSNTWSAYQCYGDPGFRLLMGNNEYQAASSSHHNYVDPVEISVKINNIISAARIENHDKEAITKKLKSLTESANKMGWSSDASITIALARAYSEINHFNQAIEFYEKAIAMESGEATLRDMEQLANIRARGAAERVLSSIKSKIRAKAKAINILKDKAEHDINRSIRDLKAILKIAQTNERMSLLASAYKRLILVKGDDATREDLNEMASWYAKAATCKPSDLYASINALSATLCAGGPWAKPPSDQTENPFALKEEFDETLVNARELAPRLAAEEHDFWSQTYECDVEVVAAIRENTLPEQTDRLVASYRDLFMRIGSSREHQSVLDQLVFIQTCLSRAEPKTHCRIQSQQLNRLIKTLNPTAN